MSAIFVGITDLLILMIGEAQVSKELVTFTSYHGSNLKRSALAKPSKNQAEQMSDSR